MNLDYFKYEMLYLFRLSYLYFLINVRYTSNIKQISIVSDL